jgi:hypothetical protein
MSSNEKALGKSLGNAKAGNSIEKIAPAYRAPKLIVLGSATALVQGNGNSAYQDGRGYYYRGR